MDRNPANDNADTWTHIAVAAACALTQIEEIKEKLAGEQKQAGEKKDDANQDAQHGARDAVLIEDRKRSA